MVIRCNFFMNEQIPNVKELLDSGTGSLIQTIESGETVHLPGGFDFLRADFGRAGPDLTIQTPDHTSFVVPDYFNAENPAPLMSEGGAVLKGSLVSQLAGPVVQGYAQTGNALNTNDAGQSIGTVMELDGNVKVTRVNGQQVTLSQGAAIYQGDIVETGTQASVGIVFADDTVFSLGTEGRMVMDEMVYDPDTQVGNFTTTIVQGTFSFVSGQVAKTSPDGMVVSTPSATIGIRGSTVLGQAAAEGAENKITLVPDVDGHVGEIVVSNAAGMLVLNQAGATTTVLGANFTPTPVSIYTNADIQNSYGSSLTSLVKTVAHKAEVDAQANAQSAKQAAQKATAADAEASQAEAQANKAEADAEVSLSEAQAAKDVADIAKQEAEAAKAEAEIAKAEAAKLVNAEAQAKAIAAEAKAAEAEAQAKADAEAAAKAEAQALQAKAEVAQIQADAQAKLDAAHQAAAQATAAQTQADASANFNSMAKAALTAQTQSTQYNMVPVTSVNANTASTAQKAATTTSGQASSTSATTTTTTDTAPTTATAATPTPTDPALAPADVLAATTTAPADVVAATDATATLITASSTNTMISGTNAVIQAATLTNATPLSVVTLNMAPTLYTVPVSTLNVTTTTADTTTQTSTVSATTYLTVAGQSIDGYISGATVFIDANNNGILDTNEVSAKTDASGNYSMQATALGPLIMTGGTDISTGQAFVGTLKAPSGSTVVTPLTTLISSLMANDATLTKATAATKLADVMGLDATVDLTSFDPVAGAVSANNATATKSAAIMKAAVQIQNTIVQAASVLQGADGTMTDANATANVFAALATQLSQETTGSTFLTNAAKLSSIIINAATSNGITNDANLTNAISTVKAVISTSNTQVNNLAGVGGDLLSGLAQTSVVAQGSAATSIKAAFGNPSALTTLNADFNTNFASKFTSAADSVGNIGVGTSYRSGNDTLTGTAGNDIIDGRGGDDIISGAAGDDILRGSGGNDTLNGGAGNDRLLGGSGSNTLSGGLGNDTYILSNATDTINENANGGTDAVHVGATFTLATNFEDLKLLGTGNFNGTGNGAANTLKGNAGNNTLDGGTGADTMIGGGGNDTYIIDNAGDTVTEAASAGTDIVKSSITITLAANVENLLLTGVGNINGTGNASVNTLTGNAGNNILDGGTGADTLVGGAGNDTYVVDNASDVVTENANAGTDLVQSSLSYTLGTNLENLTLTGSTNLTATGNALNNTITGNTGNNTLDGGTAGTDSLLGGAGNDTYIVDRAAVTVTENRNSGTDTVKSSLANYTLATNVENLTLTGVGNINGTGNASVNTLTGNAGNNILDGGTGADTLVGGAGNDTYIVDNASDVVTESISNGTDLVQSSVTFTLAANVENLTLTGVGNVNGTGNASVNTLTGNAGNNILDGGTGADTLVGGAGNDTYVVDNASDVVTENANAGTDLIQSSLNYTLGANLENLTLTGTANLVGTGNAFNNTITGNTGINVLYGDTGNDTISGGNGEDVLLGGAGIDSLDGGLGRDVLIGGTGNDTAIFANAYATYTLTVDSTKSQVFVKDASGIVDIVQNVENLKFSDQTIATSSLAVTVASSAATGTSPVAPTGNAVNIGGAASYTGNISAPSGSVLYDWNMTTGAQNTYSTGVKSAVYVDDLATISGTSVNHGGLLSGDSNIDISGTFTNAATGVVATENYLGDINILGGTTTNFGMMGVNTDVDVYGSSTFNNYGLVQSWEDDVEIYGASTVNNYGAIFASDDDFILHGTATVNNFGLISVPWSEFTSYPSGWGGVTQTSAQVNNFGHIVTLDYNLSIGGQGLVNFGVTASRNYTSLYDNSTTINHGKMIVTDYSLKMYDNSNLMNLGDIIITDDSVIAYNQSHLANAGTITAAEGNLSLYNTVHAVNSGTVNLGQGLLKVYDTSVFYNASTGVVNANTGMIVQAGARAYNDGTINVFSDSTYTVNDGLKVDGYLNNTSNINLTFGDLKVYGTIDNSGTLIVGEGNANIYSTGVMNISSTGVMKVGGTLNLVGNLNNEGTVTTKAYTTTGNYAGGGTLITNGALDIYGALTTSVTGTVTSAATTLGSLTNNGSVFVNGTLGVTGALVNNSMLQTAGTVTAFANLTNASGATFMVGGSTASKLVVAGNITNSGILTTPSDIDVTGSLTNSGQVTTTTMLYVGTTLTNNSGSVVTADTLDNGHAGTTAIVNSGEMHIGGKILNVSTLTNNTGGVISAQGVSLRSAATRYDSLHTTSDVNNSGDIILTNDMTVGGVLNNTATGNINSADSLHITGTITNAGNIGANYEIHGVNLINQSGAVLTSGDSSTFTGTTDNQTGAIMAVDNSLYLNGAVTNVGTMLMGNGLNVGLVGAYANLTNSGSITMENNFTLYGNLINQAGAGITVAGVFNDYGNTSNAGTISIRGAHAINSAGTYTATIGNGADGTMVVQGSLTLGGTLDIGKDAGYNLVDGTAHTLFGSSAGSILGSFSSYVNNLTADWGLSIVQGANSLVATIKAATTTAFNGLVGDEILVASSGNDILVGSAGNDILYGGSGTDTVSYTAGSSAVSVNLNTTTAQVIGGGMGSDTLNSIESVIGSAFSDTIVLSSSGGSVLGRAGGDAITGGAGVDIIRYTATTDGAAVNAVTGMDTISGFTNGTDKIRFEGSLFDDIGVANNVLTFATNTAANFTTTHEAMLLTGQNIANADLTTAGFGNVLAAINATGVSSAATNNGLIMVQGVSNTALFSFTENGTTLNNVTADELSLLGIVSGQLLDTTSIQVTV